MATNPYGYMAQQQPQGQNQQMSMYDNNSLDARMYSYNPTSNQNNGSMYGYGDNSVSGNNRAGDPVNAHGPGDALNQWYQQYMPVPQQATPTGALPYNPAQVAPLYDPSKWSTPALQQQYSSYLDNTIPLAQLQQNAYQYGNDFNEAIRRWNAQFFQQQGNDTFQQDFANRQLSLQELQNQQQTGQWGQEFSRQQGLDQWNQGFAQQQLAVDQAYKNGQLSAEQYRNETGRLQAQQQYELGRLNNQTTSQNYQNQYNLGLSQNDIARQRLAQEGQLAAQQMENARVLAAIQATGRNQAPVAKFIANWG